MTTTTETPTLSRKQQQVYDGLEAGKNPGAIAKQMKITRSAVYGHMRQMRRLGVTLPNDRVTLPNETPDSGANGQQPVELIGSLDPVLAAIAKNISMKDDELKAIGHDIEQTQRKLRELNIRKADAEARIESYTRAREALDRPNGQVH